MKPTDTETAGEENEMKEIGVKVGDKIKRLGSGGQFSSNLRPDGTRRTLEPGDIGEVVEVHPARAGLGSITDLDGEEIPDPDRDGYAVVSFPNWLPQRIVIRPEDAGKRWRVKERAPCLFCGGKGEVINPAPHKWNNVPCPSCE